MDVFSVRGAARARRILRTQGPMETGADQLLNVGGALNNGRADGRFRTSTHSILACKPLSH